MALYKFAYITLRKIGAQSLLYGVSIRFNSCCLFGEAQNSEFLGKTTAAFDGWREQDMKRQESCGG